MFFCKYTAPLQPMRVQPCTCGLFHYYQDFRFDSMIRFDSFIHSLPSIFIPSFYDGFLTFDRSIKLVEGFPTNHNGFFSFFQIHHRPLLSSSRPNADESPNENRISPSTIILISTALEWVGKKETTSESSPSGLLRTETAASPS